MANPRHDAPPDTEKARADKAEAERDALAEALHDILGCDPYETKEVARAALADLKRSRARRRK